MICLQNKRAWINFNPAKGIQTHLSFLASMFLAHWFIQSGKLGSLLKLGYYASKSTRLGRASKRSTIVPAGS